MKKHKIIIQSPVKVSLSNYNLKGDPVINQTRKIKDLIAIFQNREAFSKADPEQLAYTVQAWMPVAEGTPGGLFFGISTILPGKIGDEYFMTKGHFHSLPDRGEFYWGVQGKGMLILMDQKRNTWAEEVYPGSLHYIGGYIAHRLANTGNEKLIVGACWPSDAGHDYEQIVVDGFSARLIEENGLPVLTDLL